MKPTRNRTKMLKQRFSHLEKASKTSFCKAYNFSDKSRPVLGTLFFVLEINNPYAKAEKIAEIMVEILKMEYFRRRHRKVENLEINFESALNRLNQALAAAAESGHIAWLNHLHAVIAAVYENQLQIASCGKAKTILIRGNETMNIVDGLVQTSSGATPMKTFTNIISGTLQKNDKLIFATAKVLDYFSIDKLRRALQRATPYEACRHLSDDLGLNFDPCALLAIEVTDQELVKGFNSYAPKISEPAAPEYMASARKFPALTKNEARIESKEESLTPTTPSLQGLDIQKIKQVALNYWKKIADWTKNTLNVIKQKINKGKQKVLPLGYSKNTGVVPERKIPATKTNFITNSQLFFANLWKKFQGLNSLSKTLLAVALLFLLAFSVSVKQISSKRTDNKTKKQYESALSEARQKEKSARDSLIYNDYDQAGKLLNEAKQLLDSAKINKKDKEEKGNLLIQIQEDFDRIDRITRVKNLQTAADLEISGIANPSNLMILDKNFYLYNSKNNSIYKLSEKSQKFTQYAALKTDLGKIDYALSNVEKNTLLLFNNKPDVFEFDVKTKELKDLDIAFASEAKIADIGVYLDRLYILKSEANEIYKHVRTIFGFAPGTEWFEDNKSFSLKNAVSIVLDESIYVLKSTGEIMKFLNGEKQDFKAPQLNTPLSAPIKIFTNGESKYLYVLEPKNKRVLVLDKAKPGEIKAQYANDEFSSARDVYTVENDKKIYILTDKKLFRFETETIAIQ